MKIPDGYRIYEILVHYQDTTYIHMFLAKNMEDAKRWGKMLNLSTEGPYDLAELVAIVEKTPDGLKTEWSNNNLDSEGNEI